jgi:hypothetical protein
MIRHVVRQSLQFCVFAACLMLAAAGTTFLGLTLAVACLVLMIEDR